MTTNGIWTIDNKTELKLLRKKMADFDFSSWRLPAGRQGSAHAGGKKYSKKEIHSKRANDKKTLQMNLWNGANSKRLN